MTDTNTGPERPRRLSEPLVLALIGLGIAALLFAGAAVPVLLSRGDDATEPVGEEAPAVVESAAVGDDSDESDSETAPAVTESPVTEPPATEPPATEPPVTESPVTEPAATDPPANDPPATEPDEPAEPTEPDEPVEPEEPDGLVEPDEAADATRVPESVATVRDGKLYLEGAVPDDEARWEIVSLAAQVFGPDNVVDEYIVDPRAGDPNLGNVQVSDAVLFETDSAIITPLFEPLLNQGLALLELRPTAEFAFEGHTDSRGSDEYNLRLSQQRADAVVRWYTDRGVDPSRLSAVGRGETEPVASDDTPEGRQSNRRIEVTINNLLSDPA